MQSRALTPSEVSLFVQLLLRDSNEPPFPRQPAEFTAALATRSIPLGYCSVQQKMLPIVDVARVRRVIQPSRMHIDTKAIVVVLAVLVAWIMLVVGDSGDSMPV